MLQVALASQEAFTFSHRFTGTNGTKYLNTKGVIKTGAGQQNILGTTQNITQSKLAEQAVQKRTEELERLNQLMINRELKMAELKSQLNKKT